MRGHDVEPLDVGGVDIFANILFADHRFVDRRFDFSDIDSDAARRIGLRVAVHEEYFFLERGKRGGKVDRSGRFSHPTLLVGDCDDFSHSDSLCPTLVRIGSWGKDKEKKVFHIVSRLFFCGHSPHRGFPLRSVGKAHRSLTNAVRKSRRFRLARPPRKSATTDSKQAVFRTSLPIFFAFPPTLLFITCARTRSRAYAHTRVRRFSFFIFTPSPPTLTYCAITHFG